MRSMLLLGLLTAPLWPASQASLYELANGKVLLALDPAREWLANDSTRHGLKHCVRLVVGRPRGRTPS